MEEAVRLRERLKESIEKITVLSIGPAKASEVLRTALAMGADDAIHVETKDDQVVEPLAVAATIRHFVEQDRPDLVLMGKQAIDDDSSQVGGMLAAMLEWPQANFASKIDLDTTQNSVTISREIDGGLETLKLDLPAVITTDLRLNQPRYASLPNIMKVRGESFLLRKRERGCLNSFFFRFVFLGKEEASQEGQAGRYRSRLYPPARDAHRCRSSTSQGWSQGENKIPSFPFSLFLSAKLNHAFCG